MAASAYQVTSTEVENNIFKPTEFLYTSAFRGVGEEGLAPPAPFPYGPENILVFIKIHLYSIKVSIFSENYFYSILLFLCSIKSTREDYSK